MQPHYKHLATALADALQLAAIAAIPLSWDVRPGQPAPVMFDRYHGETIDFAATFRGFGELPFAPGADIRLWFQTNGMGSAWWSVPATVQSNVLSATWSPALDPGAERVSLFFGAPSNAYAAAVLRLRHSPGFAPGALPDPESFHESDPVFAAWLSSFQESDPVFSSWLEGYTPPETSLEPSTNYTHSALCEFARTGTVARAETYGTPTRWTDATGCVWESSIMLDRWLAADIGLGQGEAPSWYGPEWYDEPDGFYITERGWWVSCQYLTPEFLGDDASQTTLELNWVHYEGETPSEIHTIFSRPVVTNLVGRVARTSDLPPAISNVVTKSYVEALGILSEEADPVWIADKPNYATKAALKSTADLARARHDYRWAARQGVLYRIDFDADGYQYLTPVTNVNALAEGNEHILIHLEEQRHGNAD